VAPEVGDEALAAGVERVERRPYRRGEAGDYQLVITATSDTAVNQAVYDDADAAGVWANSADDPDRCSFTLPAVHRQGPVVVTASTGGASPALAAWLRSWLEEAIGPEFAALAAALAEERARVHAAGRSTEDVDWRPLIEATLARLREAA
jgi:siroheme synthase-like protein